MQADSLLSESPGNELYGTCEDYPRIRLNPSFINTARLHLGKEVVPYNIFLTDKKIRSNVNTLGQVNAMITWIGIIL